MASLLERNAAIITSPRGFLTFIAMTLTALALIRAFAFPGVGGDDGEQLVFSQFIDWGYQVRNPPMVTWLLIGLQKLTGPSVLSIVALRMLIVFAIYLLSFRLARMVLDNDRLATLSAGSLLMVFYVGWNTIHGFTHTSLVTVFYLAATILVWRLRGRARRADQVALGVVLGLGLLAKYAFLLYALALLIAAAFETETRKRLISGWLVAGFALTLPLVVPQALWLLDFAPADHLSRIDSTYSTLDVVMQKVKGIVRLVPAVIGFLLPLLVVWLAVFWTALRHPPEVPDERRADLKLFERLFFLLLAIAAIAILAIQSDRLRSHYLFVLIPLMPYFFLRFGRGLSDIQIRRFAAVISLAGVTLIAALVAKYFIEPLVCGHCEDHVPYDTFSDELRDAGFKQGTIFAYFHKDPLAGNLRVRFPGSRVVSAKHPRIVPPSRHAPGQCLIVWPVKGAVEPKSATILTANQSPLATGVALDHPSKKISGYLPPYGKRLHQLEYVLIEKGAGMCR